MRRKIQYSPLRTRKRSGAAASYALIAIGIVVVIAIGGLYAAYTMCRIDVPAEHFAVLTTKTGKNLENGMEVAPGPDYKGLQLDILTEGRYFYNPYYYEWAVYPMVKIPEGKVGVRTRLYGQDLPYGDFVAPNTPENKQDPDANKKGILPDVLIPSRYAINALVRDADGRILNNRDDKKDYVEIVEIHDMVTIPAGFKGVITNLSGPIPTDSNQFLVDDGFRGVQKSTLDEGTFPINPYVMRIQKIDTRSQRFNLSENYDMGFPSKDGFWVSLDGIIEFHVKPENAALVYVMYDESKNDASNSESAIDQEIIRKVIMPNARSFCRLQGSNSSGRDFIGGETRSAFQEKFENAIRETCEEQGIEIVQALITKINPPQAIAEPVRTREVASQKLKQFQQQKLQQDEEAKLAKENALILQLSELVGADQEVVKTVTEAMRRQDVAIAEATRDKEVAVEQLAATKDKASAIMAEKKAEAAVVGFKNEADSAGWKAAVSALDGDGEAFARYVLYQKLAPGFKTIMANTSDSPLMDIFKNFTNSDQRGTSGSSSPGPVTSTSTTDVDTDD